MTLSNKQKVFVEKYLQVWNATEAARLSGYTHANKQGPRLLVNVGVKEQIQARIEEIHMSADEALLRLSDMARGDIGDLIDDNGLLDLRTAREKGMTKLIRKIKQKTVTKIGKTDDSDDVEITEIEFEMYSAKDAIDTILKAGGKIKDNEVIVKAYIGINPDDWDKDDQK